MAEFPHRKYGTIRDEGTERSGSEPSAFDLRQPVWPGEIAPFVLEAGRDQVPPIRWDLHADGSNGARRFVPRPASSPAISTHTDGMLTGRKSIVRCSTESGFDPDSIV